MNFLRGSNDFWMSVQSLYLGILECEVMMAMWLELCESAQSLFSRVSSVLKFCVGVFPYFCVLSLLGLS